MTLDSVIMDRCGIKFVPHKQHSAHKWRTSLDDYFEEFFDMKRGDYFMWNIAVIGLMVLGLLLFLGLLDRLIAWVKSGA